MGLIHFYSCLAHLHLLANAGDAAEEVLQRADAIRQELQPVPWQVSVYLRTRAELDLYRLQESVPQGRDAAVRRRRKQARQSCRALIQQSRKVAQFRTDACRLMGLYHWLTDQPQRAFRWWRKALRKGPGARIQVARAHFEIGRRLMEAHSPAASLNGIDAQAHLEKARKEFEELNLSWDLKQLRLVAHNNECGSRGSEARDDPAPGR